MLDTPQAGLKTLSHRSDWTTARLKFLFKRETRPVEETDEVVTAFRDGTVTLRKNRREDGFTFAEQEIGYQGIDPGDLVIHAMDGFAGAIGVSDSRGKGSPVLSIATPQADAEPRFWAYYLRNLAVTGFIQSLAKGIRERSTDFRWKDASNLLVNFPDLATQRQIADFLDRETARIDLLIEKKQRLVALLGEKFRAFRKLAIQCGFQRTEDLVKGPNDWFALTPDGWTVKPLRHVVLFQRGHDLPSEARIEGKYPIYSSGGISGTHSVPSSKAPGIVTGRYGTIGKFHFVENDYWALNTSLYSRAIYEHPRYVFYLLQELAHLFILNSSKSAVPGIDRSDIHSELVPVPPLSDQVILAQRLDALKTHLNAIEDRTNTSIDRLKEYRSALITAAVTGQIDVSPYAKSGTPDHRLDAIQEEMSA